MKNKIFYGLLSSGIALAAMTSCVSEMPFGFDGEGTVRMQLVVNSELTRAEVNDDDLRSKCVVYISGQDGLLYKYKGLEEVPNELKMKAGNYVAEAWTGDSVTASYDKKFYRGYQKFAVTDGDNTSVVLECKIGNVVVSINPATVLPELMKDWKITISNSRGSLTFSDENIDKKGYFMMPDADIALGENGLPLKADDGWNFYTNLKYTIEGNTIEGKPFSKSGTIGNATSGGTLVQRAHEYILNFNYDPKFEETGGSFITVEVDDSEILVKGEVDLYSKPAIKGVGFDITKQVVGNEKLFQTHTVRVSGFGGLQEVRLSSKDYDKFGLPSSDIDLMQLAPDVDEEIKSIGIDWDYKVKEEKNLVTSYITFSSDFLNNLEERDEEYVLTIYARDVYERFFTQDFRIAVGEGAIVVEDPVTMDEAATDNQLMILAKRATLTGTINADDVMNPQVRYRAAGSSDAWQYADIALTRSGSSFTVTLRDLKPGTRYEYQGVASGFEPSESKYFTTEPEYQVPNAGLEDWFTFGSKNIYVAGAGPDIDFWDSGNHGSAMMSKMLTTPEESIIHGGNRSAKLLSQFVGLGNSGALGKFAAGNLFVGAFGSTDGMNGANLTFGRPYDGGSHPDALKVWVSYTPSKVGYESSSIPLKKGQMDQGQIFIAFSTKPFDLQTGKKVYFNPDDEAILGYGEKTFEGAYGSSNSLAELTIPVQWRPQAKNNKPLYIIIVASASKYGDYFVGGDGSVMYLDDFELVY